MTDELKTLKALEHAEESDWEINGYPAYIPVTQSFQASFAIEVRKVAGPKPVEPETLGWYWHGVPLHIAPDETWFGISSNGEVIDIRPKRLRRNASNPCSERNDMDRVQHERIGLLEDQIEEIKSILRDAGRHLGAI